MFNHSLPCSNRTWGPNFVAQMFSLKSVHLRELDHALDLLLDSAALTAKSSAQKRNHKNEPFLVYMGTMHEYMHANKLWCYVCCIYLFMFTPRVFYTIETT